MVFDHFPRNLLKINLIALKSARFERRQNRVTYNNLPVGKPEKEGIFGGVYIPRFSVR